MQHQMRGVSASSLAEVIATVESVAGSGVEVSSQLFAAVSAIDGAPALRRVLTDPSTDASAKQALVRDVFGSAFGSDAVRVLETATAGRWASPRDFTDGVETAGVTAQVIAADAAGELDALETELFEIGRTVHSDDDLRGVIADRTVPADAKASLLTSLFGGKVSDSSLALAVQAAVARRGSFERTLTEFGDTAAARRDRLLAEVRVAYELGESEKQRLAAALSAKYGRDVHLNIVVDPSVVGGIAVSVGDELVDGTMSTRLETARRQLAG